MILTIIPLLVILQHSQSSVVIDSYSQKGIYVSDYCPSMKYCAEGAHVMCMYYDPNRTYGPRCSSPRNVTITPDLANQLLDIANAIRSRIANGKETGFNNTRLPRGYGIFRLRWDNELATFAQIFANQCILRHDFCRATKKFPEPGQTAGVVRFTYPGWDPISATTASGLNDDKLSYSVAQVLKSWYSQKSFVTEDMIKEYPNWESRPNLSGRLYLELIHGPITHMGCGMSAYTEFIYYQNRPMDGRPGGQNYNSIEIICNFSSRPKMGQMTYWTSRPKSAYTGQCGCPDGSQEDDDCLCNEVIATREQKKKGISMAVQTEPETCPFPENNCEPTLVLLPIFTVEDAPPEKLIERARDIEEPLASYVLDRLDNRSNIVPRHKSVEIYNFFEDAEKERQSLPSMPHALKTVLMSEPDPENLPKSPIAPISLPTLKKNHIHQRTEVLRSNPDTKLESEQEEPEIKASHEPETKKRHASLLTHPIKRVPTINKAKKSSIFSRAAKFKLPNGRRNFRHYEIKSDVKPRKDFKNMQRVVDQYLKRRNNKNKITYRRHDLIKNKLKDKLEKATIATTIKEEVTEAILNKAEEKVMNFNQYLKQKNNATTEESPKHFDLGYEDGDNKLMSLLDTLEREVKHIELGVDEKELFDAKIRKIYGTVVGKPTNLLKVAEVKGKSTIKPVPLPSKNDRESDFLESDFGEPKKAYSKYDNNNLDQKDIRSRTEFLSEDDKKGRNYDYADQKYKERTFNRNKDDKDLFDNNDNDLFETDQKIFSDIERKYNERLARSKLERKNYDDLDERKYGEGGNRNANIPARNQNSLSKYDSNKARNSAEERKKRILEKFRDRDSRTGNREDTDRNYYRNGEDDRKQNTGDSKRGKNSQIDYDNPLSSERRKYYQDKLENLERRLHNARSYRRRNNDDLSRTNERPVRRMRPNLDDLDTVRSRSKLDSKTERSKSDSFYMPDRARFLHGF